MIGRRPNQITVKRSESTWINIGVHGMYIEKARSDRSTCKTCMKIIPKGALRMRPTGVVGVGDKMCMPCLKAELLLAGISLMPLTDEDAALLTAKILKGELKREQLMFDPNSGERLGKIDA